MPIEKLKQLLIQLRKLTKEEFESEYDYFPVEDKFSVPQNLEFRATKQIKQWHSQADRLIIWFRSKQPLLFHKQTYLRNVYKECCGLAESKEINMMFAPEEFLKEHITPEYVEKVEIRTTNPYLYLFFQKNYPVRKGYVSRLILDGEMGIFSKGRKLSKELGLERVSSSRAWKDVDTTTRERIEDVIEDLRRGVELLCRSSKSFFKRESIITPERPVIKVRYKNIPSEYLPSSGLVSGLKLGAVSNSLNFSYSQAFPPLFPYETEIIKFLISLYHEPVFLKYQSEILNLYEIIIKDKSSS